MSKEEILLELVLDKCSNIKEVLSATKDIENYLIKLKSKEKGEVGLMLEKAKSLVDSVYYQSINIKKEFYIKFDELTGKDAGNCENSIEDNTSNNNQLPKPKENLNTVMENNETQGNDNAEEHTEEITIKDVDAESTNHLNNIEEDPLKSPESPDTIENSIIENEKDDTNDIEPPKEDITEEKSQKSLIRLVDLSKLIDPKQKSGKFDTSIIILTSSDEETKSPKKVNDAKENTEIFKSTLKSEKQGNICKNKVNGKNVSGTEKNICRSKHDQESEENDGDVEVKKKSRHENKTKVNDKTLSDTSFEEISLKEKSAEKKKQDKTKQSGDTSNYFDNESENSSGNESKEGNEKHERQLRKSSRLQVSVESKKIKRHNLRKLFKRRLVEAEKSSSESDDSDTLAKNKSFEKKKKKDFTEEHLSDTSSLSSTNDKIEIRKANVKENKETKRVNGSKPTPGVDLINKFKCDVYVPLPRVECNSLKEIYLKNKDIFEVKRLCKLNMQRSQKRDRQAKNHGEKSSSEGEKPLSKKCRSTISKKNSSPEDTTSDEEPLKNPSDNVNSIDPVLKENTNNPDELMAGIVMDGLNVPDDENKLHSSSSESELDSNKTDKEKVKDLELENDDGDNKKNDGTTDENKEENVKSKKEEIDNKKKDESSSDDDKQKRERKKWRKDQLIIDSSDSDEETKKFSKKKKQSENESESDIETKSSVIKKRKVKKRRKAVVISDSDRSNKEKSEDSDSSKKGTSSDEANSDKDVGTKEKETNKKAKKRRKAVVISDSDRSNKEKSEDSDSSKKGTSSDEANSDKDAGDKEEESNKKTRKRIKRTNNSSSSSEEDKSTRKQIRRVLGTDSLSETTKRAEAEEKERKARIAEKQKKYNNIFDATAESTVSKLVLDYDEKHKRELLTVDKKIVKKLKPHQASGIQFMWDACFESIERAKKTKGSGCVLAHCMGLGKTLQVIALSHTLLTNKDSIGFHKILVVCPINTVLNWKSEFKKWVPKDDSFEVYELVSCKQNYMRQYIVNEWHNDGGVLIIGYTMFRNITNPDNKRLSKKMRQAFHEGLVDPGPDLVVCDEGHLLKNEKTHLSIAMNRLKTARRIVLTGTPLQNNLKEYWCMVQFIKPNLLGTYKEYLNRFVNPITNGQYTDSTQHDILLMRKRSHVLHKLLDGVVQRKDYAVLEPYLPPKQEYVLFIKLSETQVKLYKHYMTHLARKNDGSNRTSFLFADFQELQRICTHPRVLLDRSKERREKEFDDEESEGSLKDFIDDEGQTSASSSGSSSGESNSDSEHSNGNKDSKSKGKQQKVRVTRAQTAQRRDNNEESESEQEEEKKEWFQEYCDGEELDNINNSGKLFLLFQILKECEDIGDKVLVFSQSLYTLNCIEYFLEKIDEATQKGESEKVGGHSGSWSIGLDYFRLDGSSSCDNRAIWCDMFNSPNNTRARLFLISTKAGGLGINLVAANRVIIFDVSWNPSHDIQSIYRVYRFGQTKPCYIYRFVTYGTMEMKIYERQVTKQAISKRVIDEQQIDRHYNQNDLQELYQCDLEPADRPIPMVPKDVLLGEMLQKYESTIYKYHLHQSLLENKEEEGLNEEERKAAWEEFENEKVLRKNTGFGISANAKVNAQAIETALASIVRKDNPTWSDVQIKGIIPALVQQLQVQLSEGDMTMYARVQQEIQLMQEMQAQKLREAFYQQQVMRMIQRQQQQAEMTGSLYVDPNQFRIPGGPFDNALAAAMNQGGPSTAPRFSNDVIELND